MREMSNFIEQMRKRRNYWAYMISLFVIIMIGVSTYQNEKAIQTNIDKEQVTQLKQDSIIGFISAEICDFKSDLKTIRSQCDSIIAIRQIELKNDSITREELYLLRKGIR